MNPIFNEYIKFLNDNNVNININEGYYWLDNQIIKAFDTEGNLHKIVRLKIDNNLNITYKYYNKDMEFSIQSWQDTMKMNNERLNSIESDSIALLKQYNLNTERTIIDTNSTGKDSMVKTYLAKKAGLDFKTYFNCTTMDVADSNIMAKKNDYIFTFPDKEHRSFYKWREEKNIVPSRLNRCCCMYFKEEPTINSFDKTDKLLFLFGMRNGESSNRSGYTDEWKNDKWGNRDWIGILPIRQYTDLDIWLYILREGIEINSKYKKGYERVGCGIVCPNYSKSTWVLDKYWYPKMYDKWQNILRKDFIHNYKWLVMNCTIEEYVKQAWTGGTFRPEPTEEVIQEFATYKEIDLDIARKYFLRHCMNGCKNKKGSIAIIKDKDVLAMNLKLFGRNTEKFKCKKCLLKEFEWNKTDWNKQVEDFKNQGCKLF